jgi:hypothetical protein
MIISQQMGLVEAKGRRPELKQSRLRCQPRLTQMGFHESACECVHPQYTPSFSAFRSTTNWYDSHIIFVSKCKGGKINK